MIDLSEERIKLLLSEELNSTDSSLVHTVYRQEVKYLKHFQYVENFEMDFELS